MSVNSYSNVEAYAPSRVVEAAADHVHTIRIIDWIGWHLQSAVGAHHRSASSGMT
jgi:hypothetical protein